MVLVSQPDCSSSRWACHCCTDLLLGVPSLGGFIHERSHGLLRARLLADAMNQIDTDTHVDVEGNKSDVSNLKAEQT